MKLLCIRQRQWFFLAKLRKIFGNTESLYQNSDTRITTIHWDRNKQTLQFVCVRRRVKYYLHYKYMFCSWLYCWLVMTKYTWSTPLLPFWCRCDLDSPFLSWVFCHKHGHSQFHFHQRRAEGSDLFLWAEVIPSVEMHRIMTVQYGNSVMSQRIVC
jgi:hypothetical protein